MANQYLIETNLPGSAEWEPLPLYPGIYSLHEGERTARQLFEEGRFAGVRMFLGPKLIQVWPAGSDTPNISALADDLAAANGVSRAAAIYPLGTGLEQAAEAEKGRRR